MTDLKNPNNFFQFNANEELCVSVHGFEIPIHLISMIMELGKHSKKKEVSVTREYFSKIVDFVTSSLKKITSFVSSEIRKLLPYDDLLKAMSTVFPQYWELNNPVDFHQRIMTLINHFCKSIVINGLTIEGILNETIFREQSAHSALNMRHHFKDLKKVENPLEEKSVTKVWTKIGQSA